MLQIEEKSSEVDHAADTVISSTPTQTDVALEDNHHLSLNAMKGDEGLVPFGLLLILILCQLRY